MWLNGKILLCDQDLCKGKVIYGTSVARVLFRRWNKLSKDNLFDMKNVLCYWLTGESFFFFSLKGLDIYDLIGQYNLPTRWFILYRKIEQKAEYAIQFETIITLLFTKYFKLFEQIKKVFRMKYSYIETRPKCES